MTASATLASRYAEVMDRVGEAASSIDKTPSDILVVAVTKYAEPEQIRELLHLGHQDFGESRVQQMVQRAAMIEEYLARVRTAPETAAGSDVDPDRLPRQARWHMIGRLQRNKAKKAVETARLIHSVDSMRLAEEIQQIALKREEPADILLQVNASGEAKKTGITPPAAPHVAEQIETMVNVRLRGLMTMAPHTDDRAVIESAFRRCAEVFEDIRALNLAEGQFNLLSMGMSGDYELAIRCGANVVRVGSALFGDAEGSDEAAHTED
jgi:pyridoxal phosphate enzyme (YggS family)